MYLLIVPNRFLSLLGNDDLKRQFSDLQKQNDRLKLRIHEITSMMETTSKENKRLKDENQMLISINEAFGQENDQLNAELERFRSFRIPRSIRSEPSSEFESDIRPVKRLKKGKKPVSTDDEEESDSEGARVCNLSNEFY